MAGHGWRVRAPPVVATVWLVVLAFPWTCVAGDRPNITIEDNVISGNGLGIYMGWHGNWYVHVSGNVIERNGEGIRIVNPRALIEGNTISDNIVGVLVKEEHEERTVTQVDEVIVRGNTFTGNELFAVQNMADVLLDVGGNWWGSPDGPQQAGASRPKVSRVWTWNPWDLPLARLNCGLSLRVSLTMCQDCGLPPLLRVCWTRATWTWWDAACWGLPTRIYAVFVYVSSEPTVSRWGNLVTGPLQYHSWLDAPPNP